MSQLRFTPETGETLAGQVGYLIDRGAVGPGQALKTRVETFLTTTLAEYPRQSRLIAERQIWETWISGTKLVV